MPRRAPMSTWSRGGKPRAVGAPQVRTVTLAEGSRPTGTLACGRFGSARRSGAPSPPPRTRAGPLHPQPVGEVARGGNPALLLRALPAGDLRGGALLFGAQRLDVLQQLAAAPIHLQDVGDQRHIGG